MSESEPSLCCVSIPQSFAQIAMGATTFMIAQTVFGQQGHFSAMCDILSDEKDMSLCRSNVTHLFAAGNTVMSLVCFGQIISGCMWAGLSCFAMFARLNAPPNIERLRIREARAKMTLLAQEQRVRERQEEQSKISQAFRLLDAFQMFDLDGNGTIDGDELQTVLTTLGYSFTESETAEMMREADVDGDGTIDYQEVPFLFHLNGMPICLMAYTVLLLPWR